MAVNARIQETAADIMKRAMLNLHEYVTSKGWRIAGTVHDEALLEVSCAITWEEVKEIENCMMCAASLDILLKVDVELIERWGEGVKQKINVRRICKLFYVLLEKRCRVTCLSKVPHIILKT
ncbi:DNA polymerase [Paenibacillus sp. QZ-Y1]|uniref:DNA polymerase n=1 Tax=Paenibacillus sp. QZ-Y1 TaxID=3414511 RepID=UPI003F79FA60